MLVGNVDTITDRFWPILYLSQVDNFVAVCFIDAESVQVMNNRHR